MTELWYPQATKDELANAGAFYIAYPWRGVLHTTEGATYTGARQAYIANKSAPHFTVTFEGGIFRARQHIPLNKAAKALRNLSGGVETNRVRCIQIEIVGYAANSGAFPGPYLDQLGYLMRWIEANTTIKREAPTFYGQDADFTLATANARQRFSNDQWLHFNGWCGHQHVPENTHWDPGAINIQHLLNVGAGGVAPMFDPPLAIRIVDAIPDVDTGQGALLLQDDGAVFAMAGARYWGGANGKPYWGTRKAARIRKPQDVPGYPLPSDKKYIITSIEGNHYAYPE